MFVEHKEQGEVTEAPAKLDEASELLLKAADLLERQGHCKNIMHSEDKHCVNGAILRSAGWLPDYAWPSVSSEKIAHEAVQRLRIGLGFDRLPLGCGWIDPAYWNNAPERTQAEVVSKLRAVALGL